MYQTEQSNSSQQTDKQPHSAVKEKHQWVKRPSLNLVKRAALRISQDPPRPLMITGMQSAGKKKKKTDWQ